MRRLDTDTVTVLRSSTQRLRRLAELVAERLGPSVDLPHVRSRHALRGHQQLPQRELQRELLARYIAAHERADPEALVRLDVPEPQCVERWTVVAERDIGDRVRVAATPPCGPSRAGDGLRVVPFFGVGVAGEQRTPDGRLLLDLRLPRPLHAGQRHECGLVVTTAARDGAYHLYHPERRCESFELTVRFAAAHVPTATSPVRGSLAPDRGTAEEQLVVDAVHEAHAAFTDLRPGLVYGIRWRPPGG